MNPQVPNPNRVLVIDDNESIHKLVVARLRPEGLEVIGEDDGERGIERAVSSVSRSRGDRESTPTRRTISSSSASSCSRRSAAARSTSRAGDTSRSDHAVRLSAYRL